MLELVPVTLREANEFVRRHHRHHRPTVGHKFSIGVQEDGRLAGVAICGRPVGRFLDDGYTLEVNRLCTDGAKNACSMLYGAAVRAAKAMGYRRVITYILDSECGASLKASGFVCEGPAGGIRGPRKIKDFVGRGGARERTEFSPQGGNGVERTLRRRGQAGANRRTAGNTPTR